MLRPQGNSFHFGNGEYVKVRVRRKIDFYFINLDLEIKSEESVKPLLDELKDKVFVTHPGGFEELKSLGWITFWGAASACISTQW